MTGKSCTFTAFLYVCMCETVFSLRSPSFFVSFREKKEEATVKIPETMTSTTQSKAFLKRNVQFWIVKLMKLRTTFMPIMFETGNI